MRAAQYFKKQLSEAFLDAGFVMTGGGLCCDANGVLTLVGFEQGFGPQWFVSVGFQLRRIAEAAPPAPHRAHIYARLERLFPNLRELILLSGELDEPGHDEALSTLTLRVADSIGPRLRELTNETALALALKRGDLEKGLVRKEARGYLQRLAGSR